MFDRCLNIPGFWTCLWFWIYTRVLNISGFWICLRFWICQVCEYTWNLNMPLVLNIPGFPGYLWFWVCKCSDYTRVLNMLMLHSVLDMPEFAWIIPEYVWIYLNMLEHRSIYLLDDFPFTFPHCNPLSNCRRGCLFQRLHENQNYILREYEAAFLMRQNLIFSLVAGSIWLNFCFRFNIFTTKISNFVWALGAKRAGGRESWFS